jgi:hypothetical protein
MDLANIQFAQIHGLSLYDEGYSHHLINTYKIMKTKTLIILDQILALISLAAIALRRSLQG